MLFIWKCWQSWLGKVKMQWPSLELLEKVEPTFRSSDYSLVTDTSYYSFLTSQFIKVCLTNSFIKMVSKFSFSKKGTMKMTFQAFNCKEKQMTPLLMMMTMMMMIMMMMMSWFSFSFKVRASWQIWQEVQDNETEKFFSIYYRRLPGGV